MLAARCRSLAAKALVATAALAASAGCAAGATQGAPLRVERVAGSTIELVDGAGVRRSGLALAGLELSLGTDPADAEGRAAGAVRLRIVSVAADRVAGVFLHEVEALDAAGAWANVCSADRDGRRLALFIEGHDTADGRQIHVAGEVSLTCTAGVQGKCLRAGYVPWQDHAGPGSGQALFQTCTRMYRADYCGDGIGWTRNGMTIDPFDLYGVQRPEVPATLAFEAGWGPGGATCVHHTRVAERGGLPELLAACPRLAQAPSGAQCTPATAAAGALIFNRSHDSPPGGPP